jgi:hypothetical protein
VPFDARKPFVQTDHMRSQLIEGLCLLAGRDVDLGCRLAHRAAVFGLAALGGVEPAGKPAQLFFDPAIGVVGLAFAARHARQHVVRVAAGCRGGRLGHIAAGCPMTPGFTHRFDGLAALRKVAQDAPGQPFPDGQAFTARGSPCGLASLGRDTGNVPG